MDTHGARSRFRGFVTISAGACWLWRGGAAFRLANGESTTPRRAAWKLFGPRLLRLGAKLIVTCGNDACVNPAHLTVEDHSVQRVRAIHAGVDRVGARNPRAVLTEADVRDIRARHRSGEKPRFIFADYRDRVTHKGFTKVLYGERWTHLG